MTARGLAIVGALLSLAVWAPSAFGCVCAPDHPAARLAFAPAAIVGVVEQLETGLNGSTHTIRVERVVKGDVPERITVHSGMTSCMVTLEPGRYGLMLGNDNGAWTVIGCGVFDPDVLIAAGTLPRPGGAARMVAAVDAPGLDTVALGARGRAAAYGLPHGKPLAAARCGPGVVVAVRKPNGKVAVGSRSVPQLWFGGLQELPIRDVSALGCTDRGRTMWAIGDDRGQRLLISLRDGKVRKEMRRPAGAVAIVGSKAYIAHKKLFRVIPLTGKRLNRGSRYDGEFTQFTVLGNRVVGKLRDGRGAVLNLANGKLRTTEASGPLAWLSRNRVLDAGTGRILDARLEPAGQATVRGELLGVEDGAAYFGDGKIIHRLARGASKTKRFAELPGEVVALTPVSVKAGASWHSCEESASSPLTD